MKMEFIASCKEAELTIEMPEPAKNLVPDWYKNTPRFTGSEKPEIVAGSVKNNSIKSCVPFYDAMVHGYIQRTWCDIYIDVQGDSWINYHFSRKPEIMSHAERPSVKIPEDYYPMEFGWRVHWFPKMPKGWSVLMTNPFNRVDLNTFSYSGIVDSDEFYHVMPGNYPFYIKKGFSGLIPKGTPMYQIIPIKRENWEAEKLSMSDDERLKLRSIRDSYFLGQYKRFFHKKKTFK